MHRREAQRSPETEDADYDEAALADEAFDEETQNDARGKYLLGAEALSD